MPDIIDFQVGLKVAIRSGNKSWRGVFSKISSTTVEVTRDDGVVQRFSRSTRRLHGWPGTKYEQPFLQTVAAAQARDDEYAEATRRAGERLGHSPPQTGR